MTYVDDIFLVGREKVVASMVQNVRETWKTTDLEDPGKQTVRFLSMEVKVTCENGEKVWRVPQENYVKDMLRKEGWLKARKIPVTKDQSMDELILEEDISADKIRRAQKVVGEMLWLVTRTRPGMMYAVSRMEIGNQVKGYLKSRMNDGLCFRCNANDALAVYTDASFAPGRGESHGCVVILS